ncbi:histidine phosphatase superfamily, partial [Dimargaris cristalligena]
MVAPYTPKTTVPPPPAFSQAAPVPIHDPDFIRAHYPSYLQLKLVQIVHRHGERTPERRRFASAVPTVWNLCHHGNKYHRQFMEALHRYSDRDSGKTAPGGGLNRRTDREQQNTEVLSTPAHEKDSQDNYLPGQYYQTVFDSPAQLARRERNLQKLAAAAPSSTSETLTPDSCAYGQLTDVGRETLFRLGTSLRSIYVDQLGFLPAVPNRTSEYYLRCTGYTRTFESLHQLLSGLYPAFKSPALMAASLLSKQAPSATEPTNSPQLPFNINVRAPSLENLYGDHSCTRYFELSRLALARVYGGMHAEWNHFLTTQIYPSAIGPEVKTYQERHPNRLNTHWLYDTLMALRAHNLPLPTGITDANLNEIERLTVQEWTESMKDSIPLLRLTSGRFINELVTQMLDKVKAQADPLHVGHRLAQERPYDPNHLKLSVYSAHDSSILPLLTILDPQGKEWPSYGANVTLELFQDPHLAPSQLETLDPSVPSPREVSPAGSSLPLANKADVEVRELDLPRDQYANYFVRVRYNNRFLTLPE